MKCPYCEKEMERGFIQCRDGITWTKKKQLVAVLSSFSKDGISLSNGAADDSRAVYAYKCDDCEKIIIDFSSRNK